MNKHLPSEHDQKKHGVSRQVADQWLAAGHQLPITKYFAMLRAIPGVRSVKIATSSVASLNDLNIQLAVPGNHTVQLEFHNNRQIVSTDFYLQTGLKDGLDGGFYNRLLNGIESAAQKAGFSSIDSDSLEIPVVTAARRGYLLNSIDSKYHQFELAEAKQLAKAAYNYLKTEYGFPMPASPASGLYADQPIKDVLNVRHAPVPEIPLYTEYLLTRDDDLNSPIMGFHKDL